MVDKTGWEKKSSNLLKTELVKRDLNYEDLRQALEKIGIQKTVHNLTKTINLGKFPFAFFLQCALAIGIKNLRLNEFISFDEENG